MGLEQENAVKALIEVHVATLLMAVATLFPKWLALPVSYLTAIRALVAICFLFVFSRWKRIPYPFEDRKLLAITVLGGFFLGLHWWTFFYSIQISTVAVGIISFFSFPVMTAVLEPFFVGSKFNKIHLAAGLLAICGIALILGNAKMGDNTILGIAWGTISALFYTMRNLISRRFLKQFNGVQVINIQLCVVVVMFSYSIFSVDAGVLSPKNMFLLLILGVFFTALPHALFTNCLRVLSATTASLISCLQPLYSVVLSTLLIHEPLTAGAVLGGALILSSAVITNFLPYRLARKQANLT